MPLGSDDADDLLLFAELAEMHDAVFQCEDGIVAGDLGVFAGEEARAALTHNNGSGSDLFSAEALDAEALGITIASVAGTSAAFFMGHKSILTKSCFWYSG